jgi:hypothetical protein
VPTEGDGGQARSKAGAIGTLVAVASVAVALLAFLLPDDPLGPRPSSAKERAPYIAQVEALCRQTQRELANLGEPDPTDATAYGEAFRYGAQHLNSLLSAWARTPSPDGDEAVIRSILDKLEQRVFEAEGAGRSLLVGDADGANQRINEYRKTTRLYREESRAYGFETCPHT